MLLMLIMIGNEEEMEISMIPLVYPYIHVITYKMEKHVLKNIILGFRFIQI